MHIILISTPIGFIGSGQGGGVELTLNSLVSGLLSLGHSVDVIAPINSKLSKTNEKAFDLLANKFNESVEVILELTQRVEKLETITKLQSMQELSLIHI